MTEFKKPKYAYVDADMILFAAASIGEQVWYIYKDSKGKEVARFDNAKAGKDWLDLINDWGVDTIFGYEGDIDDLIRETEYEIKDFEDCKKAFKKGFKKWVKQSGCTNAVAYISKGSGVENFRYKIATVKKYKGNRKDTHKPHYLEQLRKWAASQPYVKIARGSVEVDDVVCGLAQKKGKSACVAAGDKDSRGVTGCWFLIPDEMEKPVFSNPKIVGKIKKNEKGKVIGYGWLFWMHQTLTGDKADNYDGCKGIGDAKSYALLEPFSGVSSDHLDEVVSVVAEAYKKAYGKEYTYINHHTEQEVQASWKDIMIENLHLMYMRKTQNDVCPIIKTVEELEL